MAEFDIITKLTEEGVSHLAETVLSHLDSESLQNAFQVSQKWRSIIRAGRLWKKLIMKNIASEPLWAAVVKRGGFLLTDSDDTSYEEIYYKIAAEIRELDTRWQQGRYVHRDYKRFMGSRGRREVGVIQCDDETIIMSTFNTRYGETLEIFNNEFDKCKTFEGMTYKNVVNRMQFDDRMIICGYEDGEIRIWDRNDPERSPPCNTLSGHECDTIVDLKFKGSMMVSCADHRPFIIIWEIKSPKDVRYRDSLDWETDSNKFCNVDFDEKYIVAGADDTMIIRVWDAKTNICLRALQGSELLYCLKYRDGLVVGAYRTTFKIWDVESGMCLRTLEAISLPYLVRFDTKRLLVADGSNSLDRIRVWDLKTILDKKVPKRALNCATLNLPKKFSPYDMRFSDFRLRCWTNDVMLTFDFFQSPKGQTNELQS